MGANCQARQERKVIPRWYHDIRGRVSHLGRAIANLRNTGKCAGVDVHLLRICGEQEIPFPGGMLAVVVLAGSDAGMHGCFTY